jgi:hypothetical protein
MVVFQRRRIRREEILPNADIESKQDDYEEEYDSLITTSSSSSIGYPSTSTKNPYDKAKTIGEEVMKKVPSKYKEESLLKDKIRIT